MRCLVVCAALVFTALGSLAMAAPSDDPHGLVVIANATGVIEILDFWETGGLDLSGYSTTSLSGVTPLDATAARRESVLVIWWTGADVRIEEFRRVSGSAQWVSFQVAQLHPILGDGRLEIAHDSARNELYLFDNESAILWGASWLPGASLAGLTWTRLLDSVSHPELSDLELRLMSFRWIYQTRAPSEWTLLLSKCPRHFQQFGLNLSGGQAALLVEFKDPWAIASQAVSPPGLDRQSFIEGATEVRVRTHPGGVIEVLDGAGLVLGTGINTAPTSEFVEIQLTTAIEVGGLYFARHVNDATLTEYCFGFRKYGTPGHADHVTLLL